VAAGESANCGVEQKSGRRGLDYSLGGPPSTSLLITAGKDVDADLRQHDDSAAPRGSS
jgi:hypothetical protein